MTEKEIIEIKKSIWFMKDFVESEPISSLHITIKKQIKKLPKKINKNRR